jgi:uncharacterized coiled-coil protein SlyX
MNDESTMQLIYALQEKLAFCEDTLHSLNDVVARQELEIGRLWDANRLLKHQLNEVRAGDLGAAEPPPPHY